MRASLVTERQSLSNGRRTPQGTIGSARRGQIFAMEAPRRSPYSEAVPHSQLTGTGGSFVATLRGHRLSGTSRPFLRLGEGVRYCKTVFHPDCRPVAALSFSQGYRVAAARTMLGNPTAQRVPLFFLTHRARVSHSWQQTVIASSGARWGRAWWSSYRLPWLSARVWPLMGLGHDPSLTRLSGLRTDTCSDPLGRHTFRAQAASCGATQGALWRSLLRQPVVRAVGPSSRLPGRSEYC